MTSTMWTGQLLQITGEGEPWFAWRPVQVRGHWRWLETVERIGWVEAVVGFSHGGSRPYLSLRCGWTYR